ncbi:hypothetical protein ACE3MS_28065 [Paenibacillus dendritiformis]|uniref:hypothetical protein n=1 Tax=Paenibacillus dendritiformis TaxID=130049 RepID=UPI0036678B0A
MDGRDHFISVEIPKFKLVVVTGPSDSGKSTLAMDTLQRECQRQYMESISCPEQTRARKKDRRHCGMLAVVPLFSHWQGGFALKYEAIEGGSRTAVLK